MKNGRFCWQGMNDGVLTCFIQINVPLFSDVDHIFLHFTSVQLGIKIPSQQRFFLKVSNRDYIFDGFVV